MTTEFDWNELYAQTQEEIKQAEIYLQSLYDKRVFVRKQLLENTLKIEVNEGEINGN
ncbi:MAG: hypothetical protein QNJ68_07890 [Microcoleaceae cyanobacterium MO_207.B10]|nr:hypothetical protein [Microcoleaceae cyanobacterium MO_207.B10]